jgi:predicted RNase H-like nuclease
VTEVGPVTGVDGCPAGWVAVTLSPISPASPASPASPVAASPVAASPGHPAAARPVSPAAVSSDRPAAARAGGPAATAVTVAVAATLAALPLAAVTGIDMPLGLLAGGWRDVDVLARRALGRRGSSVFAIPPRRALEAPSYAEANRLCRELTGKGLSVQAYGLRRKIAEAEEYRRAAGTVVGLYEVHPELAFAALAGAPLADSKHTPAGLAIRRGLLRTAGIELPAKVARLPENDLLDAAAAAWSARRIATGQAVVIGNPAERSDDGTEIAVRY